MSWIVGLIIFAIVLTVALSTTRSGASRRNDRLESAFVRARGQRMVSTGIRSYR